MELFGNHKGAQFSACKKYRYALWRIWDETKPMVMFIGLNPSTANEIKDDPTIDRVCKISKHNGYGGVYMLNCFPFVSTDPDELWDLSGTAENKNWLKDIALKCKAVVFAWGNFKIVKKLGVDYILSQWFPHAKALHINKNGSPKRPLFCRADTWLIDYKPKS